MGGESATIHHVGDRIGKTAWQAVVFALAQILLGLVREAPSLIHNCQNKKLTNEFDAFYTT